MIIAEEYLCRAANEYAKSAQDFYCTSPTHPEVWSAAGTWAGVIVAIFVGIYARRAWKTSKKQLEQSQLEFDQLLADKRQEELRDAAARLMRMTHDLIKYSDDEKFTHDDFRNLRRKWFEESLIFELSVGEDFDSVQFNRLSNWTLKAAGMRHGSYHGTSGAVGRWFGSLIPNAFLKSLREYVRTNGTSNFTEDLTAKYLAIYHHSDYAEDPDVKKLSERYPLQS